MNTEIQEILKNDVADIKQQILIQSLKCLKYSFNGSFDRMYNAVNRAIAVKMANKHENQKTFNGIVKDLHNYNKMLSIDWSEIANTFNHPKQNLIGGKIYSKIIEKLIEKKDIEVYSYGTNWMEKNTTKYCKRFVVPKAFLQNYVTNNGTLDGAIEKAISEASNRIKRRIQKKFGDIFSLQKEKDIQSKQNTEPAFTEQQILETLNSMNIPNNQVKAIIERLKESAKLLSDSAAILEGKPLEEIAKDTKDTIHNPSFDKDAVAKKLEQISEQVQQATQTSQTPASNATDTTFAFENDIPEDFFVDKPKQKHYYNPNNWLYGLYHKFPELLERNISPTGAKRICDKWFRFPIDIQTQHTFIGQTGNCDHMLLRRLYNCIYAAYKEGKFTLNDVYDKQDFQAWLKDYEAKMVA